MNDQAAPAAARPTFSAARLVIAVCAVFLTAGMAQSSIGPVIPDLARQTNSNTVAAGGVLSAFFIWATSGQLIAGFLLQRIGQRQNLLLGITTFLAGFAGLILSSSLVGLLLAASLAGFGFGMAVLTGNVVIAETTKGAGALNLVNALYGVGAILSPALVGISIMGNGSGIPALWAVPLATIVCMALVAFWVPGKARVQAAWRKESPPKRPALRFVLGSPLAWAFCALAFVELALETSVSGWLPIFLLRASGLPIATGAIAVSWFWSLITIVRLVTALISRFARPVVILRVCIGASLFGGLLFIAYAQTGMTGLGLVAATTFGIALGPVVPTLLAIVRASFPENTGVATGLVFGVANIGGAVVPWALGAILVNSGALPGSVFLFILPLEQMLLLVIIECLFGATSDSKISQNNNI